MTEGPSPLYALYPMHVFFEALWKSEIARLRQKWEGERSGRISSWKDIVVLDSSQPVHLEPLSKSPMDKLFDEIEGKEEDSE